MKKIFLCMLLTTCYAYSSNQTADVSPILVDQPLPFSISIKLMDFTLPQGIQSAAAAQHGHDFLFITGRTNGMHNFDSGIPNNNFPPNQQNSTVFVINPYNRTVKTRSLHDPLSGLTQKQIDTLSVTSPQSYQKGHTLYITGGYGIDTHAADFSTKDTLTAIDVPGLIHWVTHPESSTRASKYIRQISHPIFKVTGGYMYQFGNNPTLLMLGQNFSGYYTSSSNGNYTEQIRRFHIIDDGKHLGVKIQKSTTPNPNYRRRDLNIVPIIQVKDHKKVAAFLALSGVFTLASGVWTVPIDITANGAPFMADPALATTFKQGMNNYACAHAELLSKDGSMYSILFGGLTYEYFQNGSFVSDVEKPFTNQITAIKRSPRGSYQQYLLPNQYPEIISTASNPGNILLFGAGARFMPACDVPTYCNGVLNLKRIKKQTTIGYIIGGIQSTLPNTNTPSDSAASPYVFKVILTPND